MAGKVYPGLIFTCAQIAFSINFINFFLWSDLSVKVPPPPPPPTKIISMADIHLL